MKSLRIQLACFGLCFGFQAAAQARSNFKQANTQGAIGETGNLYIVGDGLFVRPFYNDVGGDTDKHLTGATQVGYLREFSDSSVEIVYNWRFITPANKSKFGRPDLRRPIGRYADWVEIQGAWAKLFDFFGETARVQVSLGVGDIGNHGAKAAQRAIHKLLGASLFGTDYDDQPNGKHGTYGVELGVVTSQGSLWRQRYESMINLGVSDNVFMTEIALNQNHILQLREDLFFALETRAIRQLDSVGYKDEQLTGRFEVAAGMRWNWYRPSIKYISPFLKEDEVGQLYVDVFAFYVSF